MQADYWELSNGIRTYSEQMTDEEELANIHNEMNAALQIVFLGFAFHDQNMSLLRPKEGINHRAQVFGTAKSMSETM